MELKFQFIFKNNVVYHSVEYLAKALKRRAHTLSFLRLFLEVNVLQQEKLLSVGIDLGTSTSQMVISELTIENLASTFSVPRIHITDKQVIYQSDIIFTPLLSQTEIDAESLKLFISEQYQKAGIPKERIQMGAVIITGETARKANASNVLTALSGYAGDFVVATAGPDLESIIAGKGAGTEILSKDRRGPVLNFDIGGGTTNLALFKNGEVISTGCFDIGGRLIKIDPNTKIVQYISPKVAELIQKISSPVAVGRSVSVSEMNEIVNHLIQILENIVGIGPKSPYYELFITNHELQFSGEIPEVTFSGGVADCLIDVLPEQPFLYGDIGLILGHRIKKSRLVTDKIVLPTVETIRATVVGAGSHTTEVSGSTISFTQDLLPIKNLPVLKLTIEDEQLDAHGLGQCIQKKLEWYSLDAQLSNVVLGIRGVKSPSFADITRYAQGIVIGLEQLIQEQFPLTIIVEEDMAKALGHSIYSLIPENYPFVCLDAVKVENGDYVDIGLPIADNTVLPVIVKTLVFN